MSSPFFTVGSKIFSKLWGNIYLAEIRKVNNDNPNDPIYTIHYLTWDEELDETVKHSESDRKIIASRLDVIREAHQLVMQCCITKDSRPEQKAMWSAINMRPIPKEVFLLALRQNVEKIRDAIKNQSQPIAAIISPANYIHELLRKEVQELFADQARIQSNSTSSDIQNK
ncbi:unnamed protein product [Caenorhabditis angaria]|uniref:Tudor-knot domain-containing protein n=1 Tax=Caenorhabditis angaria TaxID=860376 RepID=A0A9P1J591_9PELO|nr:unnamed protein product [Caenorhabditis angaria]